MRVLVDSDVLIEVCRGRNPQLTARWLELGASDALVLYTPVSVAELWAGARPREHAALQALFDALECVPATAQTGRRAGEFLHQYRASHGVELGDALIAAAAASAGAHLWTRNRKHYPMKELKFFE